MDFTYKSKGNIGIGNVLDTILKNKGIKNVSLFLNPNESCLEEDTLLDNIEIAADLLIKHNDKHSHVTVVQDCDVDGVTSATLIMLYMARHFKNLTVDYVIHDNKEHGLDDETMLKLSEKRPDLVIIPDAGSNDLRQLKTLRNNNIDVIVLDHHDESKKVSRFKSIFHLDNLNQYALIVNNQMSKRVTDKAMTGVGIAYKFCKILDKKLNVNTADDYLDLVAVGMIADSCDLTNLQSRYLVLKGLEQICNGENMNLFITELVNSQMYSLHNKVTIIGISFYIAPLINSLIRLGSYEDKEIMLKAFLNSDETVVTKIRGKGEVSISIQEKARRLCETHKRKQKTLTDKYTQMLSEQIDNYGLNNLPVLCCKADSEIEKTFTGLIANKLTSMYKKPCILLRETPNTLMGSARGFDKSSINDIKQFCLDTKLFTLAEGHSNACGVSIKSENIPNFYEYLSNMECDTKLHYDVDTVFNDKTLNKSIVESISNCSDVWGTSVEEPVFAIENIVVNTSDIQLLGEKKNTIKFTWHNIDFIKFNTTEDEFDKIINTGKSVDFTMIGRFSINEYNGTKTPQVLIENMTYKPSSTQKKFVF